jgi:hypothetical protein
MAVQGGTNIANLPFILSGDSLMKESETVLQDAGRGTADMVIYTLMAYNPTSKKWVPFTDETAVDGTQIPKGILMRTLDAADIVAGDVLNVPIVVGGSITIDKNQLVIENSKTLDTIVNVPTNLNQSVSDLLQWAGIYPEDTVNIDEYENP